MKKILSLIFLLLYASLSIYAQKVDVDELLKQASHEANERKDYARATELAQNALAISPDYIDVRLLLGKIYVLTKELDKASTQYDYVLKLDPKNPTALAAIKQIASQRAEEKITNLANRVGLTYNPTFFEKEDKQTWHLWSLYYARQEKFGSLIGRINFLDRVYAKGYQLELEAYPKHQNAYSYINLAYSNAAVFQKYRASYSYIRNFANGWEGEIGIRYQYKTASLFSYGAAVGKYLSNYWLNLKAFITPNDGKIAQSYTLTSRYYFSTADDYLTAIMGTGISPDDRTRNINFAERIEANSFRFSLGYQQLIWHSNTIGILGTYNRQMYVTGKRENEYDLSISFQHRF